MNVKSLFAESSHYYRGVDMRSVSFETTNPGEGGMAPQAQSAIEATTSEKEPLSKEREEQLEAFMDEIKQFIRKIDVNNL